MSLFTFIGLALGIVFGLCFKDLTGYTEFIGQYYITALKFLIVPVIFTSISVSIFKSRNQKNGLIVKTVLLFIIMFTVSFLLSSLVVTIMNPSKGFSVEGITYEGDVTDFSIKDIFLNLIPKDAYKFFTGGYLFFVIIVSIIVGYVSSLFAFGEKIINVIDCIKEILYKVLGYLNYVTPFAVFSLISVTVAKYGSILLGVGLKYILTAFVSSLVILVVVMILPVLVITKMSPVTFIKKVYRIWLMTISTCSSSATLPYTIKLCKEELNIPDSITDVVVPLGCTIHMCGGAVSFSLLGLFCLKLYGIHITFGVYLLMLVYALLINMSAPGIPNGGVVIGASYLGLLGIPLDFIGFYSGIYKILDMMYTTLNVTGDITANVILNEISKD